jgi:hypothetical protein
MGLYRTSETRRYAAVGPAVLLFCALCVVSCAPAGVKVEPGGEGPDQPPEPPAKAGRFAVPATQDATDVQWDSRLRDLPPDQGDRRYAPRTEVRDFGYTAMELLIVALVAPPACFLGVLALRFLVRWMQERKLTDTANHDFRQTRRECQTWRHQLRSWRETHRRR